MLPREAFPSAMALLDGLAEDREEVLRYMYAATATALLMVGGFLYRSALRTGRALRWPQVRCPPRIGGWPLVGAAPEFGADCRAFLRGHFSRLGTPVFTAPLAGRDFHFVDAGYPELRPEVLFRCSALSFRPIADDALVHGFGVSTGLLRSFNGTDGTAAEVNALYREHMMRAEGLARLLERAQVRLDRDVFADGALYPAAAGSGSGSGSGGGTVVTRPLYRLVQESLFRASVGAVISESIAARDASGCLRRFEEFDERFPLLLSRVPAWMFPRARRGRQAVIERCRGPEFRAGLSSMIRQRNEVIAKEEYGITGEDDVAVLTSVLIWAATANTMPAGFWLIYNMLKHKETAYEAIRREVSGLYEGRTRGGHLTMAEVDQLAGLESALTESLRIYSESMIARDVMEDVVLDLKIPGSDHRYFLKRGSRVAVMMSCLHMDDSVFADARNFQWDRFLPDERGRAPTFAKGGKIIRTPVRPFGGGVSMCPGRKFASYEIKAFVAELVQRYDLELVDRGKELKTDPSRAGLGVNVPLQDVDVRISKRIT